MEGVTLSNKLFNPVCKGGVTLVPKAVELSLEWLHALAVSQSPVL